MVYYFAHPVTIYNTKKEQVLIDMIRFCPYFSNPMVVNPNSDYHQQFYEKQSMPYFLKLVDGCDAVVAYPFEDGTIGAGVEQEMQYALDNDKRVFLINPETFDMPEIWSLEKYITLSVEETRAKIKEIKSGVNKLYS